MSKQRLSKSDIPSLKRLAKAIKRDQGISHSEALDQVAQAYGYRAWSHLQSATPEEDALDRLLKEFLGGQRDERHFKLVIVLWENLKDHSLSNRLLSLLSRADAETIQAVYSDFRQKSSRALFNAIEQAKWEPHQSSWDDFDREQAPLEEAYIEQYFDKMAEEEAQFETESELGAWLAPLPGPIQKTILNFSFTRPDNGATCSLNNNLQFYQTHRARVEQVLIHAYMLYECPNFRDTEVLSQWLTTASLDIGQGLCPLDALWHDAALDYLSAFAEEMTDTKMIDAWVREPETMPARVRHLLVSQDVARANLPVLREAEIEVIVANLEKIVSRTGPLI